MRIDALPAEIVGPSAWLGPEVAASERWIHHLSDAELRELEQAARQALSMHSDIAAIRRESFVLPTLGPRLAGLHDTLIHGCGFALVRALPVESWTREITAAAFLVWVVTSAILVLKTLKAMCWAMSWTWASMQTILTSGFIRRTSVRLFTRIRAIL